MAMILIIKKSKLQNQQHLVQTKLKLQTQTIKFKMKKREIVLIYLTTTLLNTKSQVKW